MAIFNLVAAIDTIPTVLGFCAYELAYNQGIQHKLYTEIMASVESYDEIAYEHLEQLPYLHAVVSETLRLHTPGFVVKRKATRDYTLGDTGIKIQQGQQVNVVTCAIHYSDDYYENPFEFNPDRFLPENKHKIKPYTYFPFGTGPLMCYGQRYGLLLTKLALFNILKMYRLVRVQQKVNGLISDEKPLRLVNPSEIFAGFEKRI